MIMHTLVHLHIPSKLAWKLYGMHITFVNGSVFHKLYTKPVV